MSGSTNIPASAFDGGQDLSNMAGAAYVAVKQQSNKSILMLRLLASQSIDLLTQAGYAAASASLMAGVAESVGQLGAAGGGYKGISEANQAEKEMKEPMQKLTKEQKQITETLAKNKSLTQAQKELTQAQKDTYLKRQDEIKAKKEEMGQKVHRKFTRANSKSMMLQALSQGLVAVPKAAEDMERQQQQTTSSVAEQANSALTNSQNATQGTLDKFLSSDTQAVFTILGSAQLK